MGNSRGYLETGEKDENRGTCKRRGLTGDLLESLPSSTGQEINWSSEVDYVTEFQERDCQIRKV